MTTGLDIRSEKKTTETLSPGAVARDITTLGSGTLLAAVFGTLVVFLIPRVVAVEDYGYWRLFVLYAGYVGLLHFGFPDGALLCWAGRTLDDFQGEIAPCLLFLICQHIVLIIPACIIVAMLLPPHLCFIAIATFGFALVMNSLILLQFGLQSARIFTPVAVATASPPGLFVLLALLFDLHGRPSFRELVVLYVIAWACALIYLWGQIKPRLNPQRHEAWKLGRRYTVVGWPILLANSGLALVQSADRLVVGSVLPIYSFAQYSLAASAMFVPVTAIVAVYRVFFPHVAAVEKDGRAEVYARTSKIVLIAWSLSLPYYFGLEVFVRHFLPKYVPGLPVAGILLLAVIFLAGIQVLHASFSYLDGRQRQFLIRTVCAVVFTILLALVMAVWTRSLVDVALGQLVALAIWWLINEWELRQRSGQRWLDWVRVLAVFAWCAISYGFALSRAQTLLARTLLYYGLIATALWFACRAEIRLCLTLVANVRADTGG
jgi:O-antigen/teichoic acid export membrane protein